MKIFLFSFLFLNISLAFDAKKCANTFGVIPIGPFVSTSSFISSTGDCSMLGLVEHDQKLFIAQSWLPLQIDIARGNGEYVDAFSEISKCNSLGKVELKKELQKNYSKIYSDIRSEDVEYTHSAIFNIMRSDYVIAKNCKLES